LRGIVFGVGIHMKYDSQKAIKKVFEPMMRKYDVRKYIRIAVFVGTASSSAVVTKYGAHQAAKAVTVYNEAIKAYVSTRFAGVPEIDVFNITLDAVEDRSRLHVMA
jgi:hypothetical protein